MERFSSFVQRWLPPQARVLEVGAGAGRLTAALSEAGHAVHPIDARPPGGSPAEPVEIERFRGGGFDAVVAARSLHHVDDLDLAFARIADALTDGGLLLLQEVCWDLLDEPTGRWLHEHAARLGLAAADDPHGFIQAWRAEHAGLAAHDQVRHRLDHGFRELAFAWVPYLAEEYLRGDTAAARAESALLRRGAIRAVSFFYAGRRRPR